MSECERGHEQSWADRKFGCNKCGERSGPNFAFSQTLRQPYDYREDLARGPGDPEAYISSKTDLQKLIDKRKAEGWLVGESDFSSAAPELPSGEDTVRDAFERARAKNFTPDEE